MTRCRSENFHRLSDSSQDALFVFEVALDLLGGCKAQILGLNRAFFALVVFSYHAGITELVGDNPFHSISLVVEVEGAILDVFSFHTLGENLIYLSL